MRLADKLICGENPKRESSPASSKLTQKGVGDYGTEQRCEVAEHGKEMKSFRRLVVIVTKHLHKVQSENGWGRKKAGNREKKWVSRLNIKHGSNRHVTLTTIHRMWAPHFDDFKNESVVKPGNLN